MGCYLIFVDDEVNILNSLRREFRGWGTERGIELHFAENAQQALEKIESLQPAEIVVVSDYRMPGMNGKELVKEIQSRWPAVKCFLLSGYSDDAEIQAAILAQDTGYLRKPWDSKVLREAIEAAFQ